MASDIVQIFVSYSHQDIRHKNELLQFLKGLEHEGIEFWSDERIATGDFWEAEIRNKIRRSRIALVLISQAFLDSSYCTNVEISSFVADRLVIFPIILSACEWERRDWLKTRQVLPSRGQTIEEDFKDSGQRKRLFLEIRKNLRKQIERLRTRTGNPVNINSPPPAQTLALNPFTQTLAIRNPSCFIGRNAEVRRISAMLQGGSVVLVGEPKIGKSSLLWRLLQSWTGQVLGFFDFQGVESREDFYQSLAEQLGVEAGKWRRLRTTLEKSRSMLVFDEIDTAPDCGFDEHDLARFRALCSQNRDFRILAASRRVLKEVFPDSGRGSPAYNFLQPLRLGEMIQAEARLLLDHPWVPELPRFDSAIVDQCLRLARGHPFKLQRAAFHSYWTISDPGYEWKVRWEEEMQQL